MFVLARRHYVNIPHDARGYDAKRDARQKGTIMDALEKQAGVLANRSAPREQRVEVLKFVIHFVGDIHQPLHCVDRNGDRGGNGQRMFYGERKKAVNLHEAWDTFVLRDAMKGTPVLEYANRLADGVSNDQGKAWAKGTPEA